jgi:endonuclease YncB( thermonuclease family)
VYVKKIMYIKINNEGAKKTLVSISIMVIIIASTSVVIVSLVPSSIMKSNIILPLAFASEEVEEEEHEDKSTAATAILSNIVSKKSTDDDIMHVTVDRVVDGDDVIVTDLAGDMIKVRLSLVNAKEGKGEAEDYIEQSCIENGPAVLNIDNKQTKPDDRGRINAVLYCDRSSISEQGTLISHPVNINEQMIKTGFAKPMIKYCKKSEFSEKSWTGC